jgi:hypothetical protein
MGEVPLCTLPQPYSHTIFFLPYDLPPALRVGANCLFEPLGLYQRSSESERPSVKIKGIEGWWCRMEAHLDQAPFPAPPQGPASRPTEGVLMNV